MKRNASLVTYGSSDDEDTSTNDSQALALEVEPPKRKLPRLSTSLVTPDPVDNPSKHKGRIRSSPHVEGQFAAYVYIPVPLDGNEKLKSLLASTIFHAKSIVPELECDWVTVGSPQSEQKHMYTFEDHELHISLTRPIYLRHYQREALKRAMKSIAQNHPSFSASFSTFATFDNDEHTRSFLGVEVGAGHSHIKTLSEALDPTLQLLHQKQFYKEPRFHASIAWALLDHPLQQLAKSMENPDREERKALRTLQSFPVDLLPRLTESFGDALSSKLGAFEVDKVKVKIGKEIFSWTLSG